MSTTAQLAANHANAQLSTGPKTEEGKAASSQNNFRHGCTGKFMLLPQESTKEFQELNDALNEEHQPATPTEILLVERMVEHFWLGQRAIRLQGFCFDDGLHQPDLQKLGVYLRYQSTHDRAFHKCLADLQKLRAEKRKAELGVAERAERLVLVARDREASQKRKEAEELRKQEMHDARVRALNAKSEDQELDTEIRTTIQAPLPGHVRIPAQRTGRSVAVVRDQDDTLKHVLKESIMQVVHELEPEPLTAAA